MIKCLICKYFISLTEDEDEVGTYWCKKYNTLLDQTDYGFIKTREECKNETK